MSRLPVTPFLFLISLAWAVIGVSCSGGQCPSLDDGSFIVMTNHFKRGWDLAIFRGEEGAYTALTDGGFHAAPSLSPDGKWLAYVSRRGREDDPYHIFRMNIQTGEKTLLTPGTQWDDAPQWSGSGIYIAYMSQTDMWSPCRIWILDVDSLGRRPMSPGEIIAQQMFPAWSPDSKRLVFIGTSDGKTAGLYRYTLAQKQCVRIFTGQNLLPNRLSWSAPGNKIAFISDGCVYTISPDGADVRRITSGQRDREPVWAPDGERILFTRQADDKADIWIVNADGSGLKRLTCAAGDNVYAQAR
jgi:Tol biopolymer transport system component